MPNDDLPTKPNFFVLGAAKCGTTTLHALLGQHPDIFLAAEKEPHFFDADPYFAQGIGRYVYNHFRDVANQPVRGEATPTYFHHARKVATRMRATLGSDLQFVIVLRNPVERAWSHYLHGIRFGAEDLSFERALAAEAARRRERESWREYYSDGLYAEQLEEWLRIFSADRFHITLTDDLANDPQSVAGNVHYFLGVDVRHVVVPDDHANVASRPRLRWLARALHEPTSFTSRVKHALPYRARIRMRSWVDGWNQSPYEELPRIEDRTRAMLVTRYKPDVKRLEGLIGRDLSHWLEG